MRKVTKIKSFKKGIRIQILLVTIALFMIFPIQGQYTNSSEPTSDAQVVVIARPQKQGRILLRWAATSPMAWQKGNQYGYQLKRYTLTRDGKTLASPEEKDLGIFLPRPLQSWANLIQKDDNAAVVAQALYGEQFEVEGGDQLSAIVNLSEEQQQRFSWALYAADQSFEAALMAGWGYEDREVKESEKYVYKVTSLVPKEVLTIEEGGVFTGLSDYGPLPMPLDMAGVFMDGKAMLSWNYAIHKEQYNSYFIQRSVDGKNFENLNKLPFTGLNNGESDAKRMFYIDSISNNKTYYYRIKGRTPFGELSPPSEVVSGEGKEVLAYVPRITEKEFLDDSRVIIHWEFLEEGNTHIKGFELGRSDQVDGEYTPVIKNIPPTAREIPYDSLRPTNYFTITAIGKNGSTRASFPALIQPVDSVPPVTPTGIKGSIDSLGVVTLTWEENPEKDMLGYRVFRGNNKTEEFSQITVSPHQGITYYDSVGVKNLNTKVFYQVVAVDQRYNMSGPSEILEVIKPDKIPPTAPVFKKYEIQNGAVQLNWANSSSMDVTRHELYRKSQDSTGWKLLKTFETVADTLATQYGDVTAEEGKQYHYIIIAVDNGGLESQPAPPLTVVVPKTSLPPPVDETGSYVDKKGKYIELYWKLYNQSGAAELMIYKGIKGKQVSLWKNVPVDTHRIVDENVKPNNEYVYMVRAVFKDGRMSKIATINVKY